MESTIVGVVLGILFGGFIVWFYGTLTYLMVADAINERKVKGQKMRRTAEKLAARTAPTILVLRSFARGSMAYMRSENRHEVILTHDGAMINWPFVTPKNLIDALLPSAVSPFLCLWFSNKNERSESIIRVGAEDAEWEQRFMKLALLCNVILIIPGRTDGLLIELRAIIANNLTTKMVLVMPSEHIFLTKGKVRRNPFAEAWHELQMTFAEAGFRLPDYTARGMVFCFAKDRSIAKSCFLYEEGHVSGEEDYDAAGIDRELSAKFSIMLLDVLPLLTPLQPDPRIYEVLHAWRT